MGTCGSCGVSIPDGQLVCSMCYGDPYYGRDGIYLKWLEDQAQEEEDARRLQEETARYVADVARATFEEIDRQIMERLEFGLRIATYTPEDWEHEAAMERLWIERCLDVDASDHAALAELMLEDEEEEEE